MNKKSFLWSLVSVLILASLALTACGGAATAAPTAMPAPTTAAVATAAPAATATSAVASNDFVARAMAGEFKGKTVTATGPFTDQDFVKFNATMQDFEQKTGITIQYTGDKNFEADIKAEIEGGSPPDVIDFPQPGLLASFAKEGKIIDLSKNLNVDPIKANYNPYWIQQSMMPDQNGNQIMAGIWERVNGKGFVYYPKKAWDAAGYQVPTTFDQLQTLMDQMVKDGTPPWCIGIEFWLSYWLGCYRLDREHHVAHDHTGEL